MKLLKDTFSPRKLFLSCLLSIWLVFIPLQFAQAIIIRHDVEDARYFQRENAYPAVFEFFEKRGGVGTLIAPDWAVTVAHVAQDVPEDHPVFIAGEEYRVRQTVLHPTWGTDDFVDLGLVQLDKPVQGVTPVSLYALDDEIGKIVTFVGWGDTGTGLTGPVISDHKLRAATNKVELADSKNLLFRFDAPTDENVTPLEGISGPGDSGGPALIEIEGKFYIMGVSVAQDSHGQERGTYGVREFYTRISPNVAWIQSTLENPPAVPTSVPKESASFTTVWVSVVILGVMIAGALLFWQRKRKAKPNRN